MKEFHRPHRTPMRLDRPYRRLSRDNLASVAIEFAIVLPILIVLLVGLIEFRSGFMVKQRTIVAATTMSNIVAEADKVTPQLVRRLEKVATTILYPFDELEIDVAIAVVTYNGVALVIEWEESSAGEAFPQEIAEEMLAGLLLTNETAIIANINVLHEPVIGGNMFGSIEFESRNVVYPDSAIAYGEEGN